MLYPSCPPSTAWRTPANVYIVVPEEFLGFSDGSYSHEQVFDASVVKIDMTFKFPSALRLVSFFSVFFFTKSPFYSYIASMFFFLLGIFNCFHNDTLFLTFCIKIPLSFVSHNLVKFIISPIAVILVSILSKQLFLIPFYLLSILSTLFIRWAFDLIYSAYAKKHYGYPLSPIDMKAIHIAYQNLAGTSIGRRPFSFFCGVIVRQIISSCTSPG